MWVDLPEEMFHLEYNMVSIEAYFYEMLDKKQMYM